MRPEAEELTNLQSLPAEVIEEIVEQLSLKEALLFLRSHRLGILMMILRQ